MDISKKYRVLTRLAAAALCLALVLVPGFFITASAVDNGTSANASAATQQNATVDISKATVTGITDKTCTGKAITQKITVKVNGKTLVGGDDYTVYYENNKAVGTALIRIVGTGDDIKGGYVGTIERTFKINSRLQKNFNISGTRVYLNSYAMIDDRLPANTIPTSFTLKGQKYSIKLSWNTPAGISKIDGFIILRKINGKYKQIAAVPKTQRSYVDKNASKRNTNYMYIMLPYKKVGSNIKVAPGVAPWICGVTTRSSRVNVYKPTFKTGTSISLNPGETKKLEIKYPKRPRIKTIRWTSSNNAVATVSDTGVVTGKKPGTATIYAKTATGNVIACKVTISSKLVGIDVSEFNPTINWVKVKSSGVSFAFIRCGGRFGRTGQLFTDSNYYDNMIGARAAGMPVGIYFFTQAVNAAEGREEAQYAVKLAKAYKLSYPIVIDTENLSGGRASRTKLSKAKRTEAVKAFCDEVRRSGYTPMIYGNVDWLENDIDMSKLSGVKVWVAQYYSVCQFNGAYKCWQYTSAGKVNGINGNVDKNYWYN